MIVFEMVERAPDKSGSFSRLLYVHATKGILQEIDPRPIGSAIEHERHDAIRSEHACEGAKPFVGVRQMMQDPGADDVVEDLPALRDGPQVALLERQVGQSMPLLQLSFMAKAGLRQVDAGDLAKRIGEGEAGGLIGSDPADKMLS
jgi:hypothetical protein